jgi:hypothetical protein
MYTEEKAKEKWCPHTRVKWISFGGYAMAVNRDDIKHHEDVGGTRCIASDCMAWRWRYYPPSQVPEVKEGYCGAFGLPDLA